MIDCEGFVVHEVVPLDTQGLSVFKDRHIASGIWGIVKGQV